MNCKDPQFRKLILTAEISAMLHDIGKYSDLFLCATMISEKNECSGIKNGDASSAHTKDFFEREEKAESDLWKSFEKGWPVNWSGVSGGEIAPLKTFGDLARWHHAIGDYKSYFLEKGKYSISPTALYLAMVADSIDSSSSKGNETVDSSEQYISKACLLTPFGQQEKQIILPVKENADKLKEFHRELSSLLEAFLEKGKTINQLIESRHKLMECLGKYLRSQLAETRIPRNDVSLWQHCYYTGSIFKAALAGRALREDWIACDDKDRDKLAHYKEKLGILGICWSEDRLIANAFRPKDVLGRRTLLDSAVQKIKKEMETEFCLGNEIFRNRDGIYFLVPSKKQGAVDNAIKNFLGKIDGILNSKHALGGELYWQARYIEIGLQTLKLADLLKDEEKGEIEVLASGPQNPLWQKSWETEGSTGSKKEICPRCGLRPIDMMLASVGSEQDRDRQCDFCKDIADKAIEVRRSKNAFSLNSTSQINQAERLLGIGEGVEYCRYNIDDLLKKDDGISPDENRLVLVQGIIHQMPFQSGEAFSSLLAVEPQNLKIKKLATNSWDELFSELGEKWENVLKFKNKKAQTIPGNVLQFFKQLFGDERLGTSKDGRVPGENKNEKFVNYIDQIALNAPFDERIQDDQARIVNYALRMHPAPSRLARMWETTDRFTREPVLWCEQNKIPYTPITRDTGQFMIVVSAARAWSLLQHLFEEYKSRFNKVRHLLPLHLSATVFYYKAPLYVAIDAAKRFAGLARERGREEWTVVESTFDSAGGTHCIKWQTPWGNEVKWQIDGLLPDGRADRFFTWFWVKGNNNRHPVHISELNEGDTVTIYPSSFDYEVLDATVRRYEIRAENRPHTFMENSPRPYLLEELERWEELSPALEKTPGHQVKQLVSQLEYAHRFWKRDRYKDARNDFIKDCVRLALPPGHFSEFAAMAMDGSLFDLIEWCSLIRKHEKKNHTGEDHE